MYQRIKNSIINPKGLANYAQDKFYKVLLYLLVFSTLVAIPYIVALSRIDTSLIKSYRQAVVIDKDIQYEVVNHKLESLIETNETYVFEAANSGILFKAYVIIDASLTNEILNKYQDAFILHYSYDGIYYYAPLSTAGNKIAEYKTDGSLLHLKDNDTVANQIFYGFINDLVKSHQGLIYGLGIPLLFIYALNELMLVVMMITIMFKLFFRRFKIPFGVIVKLAIYSLLPLSACLMFSILLRQTIFGTILYYLGFLLSMVYCGKACTAFIRANLQKVEVDDHESI